MKSKIRTTKSRIKKRAEIQEAMALLNKAIAVEEPHIQIRLDGGLTDGGLTDSPESKKFLQALKAFKDAYQEFYGSKHIKLEVLL